MTGVGFAALLLLAMFFTGVAIAGSPDMEEVERDDG